MTTTDPTTTDTYRKIAARLTMLRPQIDLKNYFAGPNPDVRLYDEKPYIRRQLEKYGIAAATTTLDGTTFLHFAVSPDRVNVHIDETGFVFEGVDGALTVGPNFVHHAGNELFWKSNPHVPRWAAEHIDLILPNSVNDFSRVGISVDMYQRKDLRVTITGSCGIFGGFECS